MVLGIFLSSGDSFTNMAKYGQDVRFNQFYIKKYAKEFSQVLIFSYANERISNLPKNAKIIPNRYNLHRFLYGFLMPFLNAGSIKKCDVFRCYHLVGTLPGIVTRIFFNKPFVFNYGYDYQEFSLIEKKYLQFVFIALIHHLANFFAAKIVATTKMVLAWTPKSKTVFIPNGVDCSLFKPTRKAKNKRIQILSVGRLETQKNYAGIIPALKGFNVDYTIIGRGSLKEQLNNLAQKNKVNLKIIEKVANTRLPANYNEADIFAQPSLTEGPTKVLLEAMACGLPVVAANVRGINEILVDKENGVFCGTNPKSIREAILLVIKNKDLREKIGKNARKLMVTQFEIDKLIQKEIKIIKSV